MALFNFSEEKKTAPVSDAPSSRMERGMLVFANDNEVIQPHTVPQPDRKFAWFGV
ncbi:hypothetical protein [Syntrophotalea acetylenica]|uniref:hypothetical protein n=1 Tax=Syntrophotalea acetylenica TaxID=29542 RepID=UPI002A35BC48|nr:hypothetical protein [Syntrophotalea acetylenica]MDY0261450.1 hypothetical protein [Syntrophotalea acetylenica]